MKRKDNLIKVLEKYGFRRSVSPGDQKEIYRINKRILKRLLQREVKDSVLIKPLVSIYYFFNSHGLSLSLKGSRRILNLSVAACMILIAVSVTLPVNYYLTRDRLEVRMLSSRGDVDFSPVKPEPGRFAGKGYRVRTGERSSYKITIGKNISSHVLSKSEMTIWSDLKNRTARFYMEQGDLYIKITEHDKPLTCIVNTPNARARVVGTEFSIAYRSGRTIGVVKKGRVLFELLDEKTGRVMAKKYADKASLVTIENEIVIETAGENLLKKIDTLSPFETDMHTDNKKEKAEKNDKVKLLSLEELKRKYNRLNIVTLYNGRIIKGVILSRGEKLKILTPKGIVYVRSADVMLSKNVK